ncbi:MAG: hypothetical protein AB7S38_40110 [Vulcanimicrobiota bacterium]
MEDVVELTALMRRHPRFADFRQALSQMGLEPASSWLLTLDHCGPGPHQALARVVTEQLEVYEVETGSGKPPTPVEDAEARHLILLLNRPTERQALESQVAGYDLETSYLQLP